MKFKHILLLTVLLGITSYKLMAQNQSPQVTNVLFTQRTDGSFFVDVYYDVNDPEGSAMTVTMQVSSDKGTTWNFPCDSITGDVGAGITNGINRHIIWDFGTEHPQIFGDQFRIKIIADDGGFNTGIPCPGEPTIQYEGITYHTVLIGTQCWLRENLNVGNKIDGALNQTNNLPTNFIEKYCYDNLEANCTTYGGLYQWDEAMKYVTTEGAQGICPDGWHIPRGSELEALAVAVNWDGNALKREDQGSGSGQGTNTSGFSALLAGNRNNNGNFYLLGHDTYIWSSTEGYATSAYNLYLYDDDSNIFLYHYDKEDGFSVRCLKD
jgi:uncharacterized protein (TIGR02145 family)